MMSSESGSRGGHVIYPTEAEAYVQELTIFKISEIGSERWSRQRERVEQLALQAVYNATQLADEFVKEFLTTHNKVPLLVHELLCVELWRERVFPLMLEAPSQPTSGFPAYMVLYSEGMLVSLLETTLFYQETCESAGDCILDLVDYCHRQLVLLMGEGGAGGVTEVNVEETNEEEEEEGGKGQILMELRDHEVTLGLSIRMKVISILQYITDHLSVLPLSVSTRLLNTHDLPSLLVYLLEQRPWNRTSDKGHLEVYEDGRWRGVTDRLKLCKVEGQVWLALYHLLLDQDCQKKYEFSNLSKNNILRLRRYMSSPLLEQIPQLSELQRYLEQLSFMDPPAAHNELIIQQVPVIYDKLINTNSKKWKTIAKNHAKLLLEPTTSQLKAASKLWTTGSHLDVMEELMGGPPKCGRCGQEASKRCSRCRNEWYCGRECQVKDWTNHKPVCDIVANSPSTD